MTRLQVALLGSPVVERDGLPVTVDTRKAIALLAYLGVTGRPHGRDALAGLLWPDADTDRSRAALRRTLSALGKGIGPGYIAADRSTIALHVERIDLDVRRFLKLIAAAPTIPSLEEAVALYRGDFLNGFALRDADPFDEWQFFQAEELRRHLSGAFERLTEALASAGRFASVIGHARRWLSLDALHEPAHRRLMLAYASDGQRGMALRQYRQCVRILDAELGVPPLEETTEVYHAIEEGRVRPEPRAASSAEPVVGLAGREGWRLVGRDRELAQLRSTYESIDGDGRLVVIEGTAGIGKTRLAEELCGLVRTAGGATIVTRCYEGEADLAYAPITSALRTAVGRLREADVPPHVRGEVGRLLPELSGAPVSPLDQPGARGRFLDAIADALTHACTGSRPGVLFVDDLQWADEASLDVLGYLVRRLQQRPMCVLVTWRSGATLREGRLRALVADARRQPGAVTVVCPSPLAYAEVEALTATTSGIGDAAAVARRVVDDTGGIPLLVVTYLEALVAGEFGEGPDLPVGVRDVLLARTSGASQAAQQALTAAAALGRPFDADLLRDVSGRTDDETVAALEELSARGLVTEHGDGYDITHPRMRELIYTNTSLARRRLLHRRIAEALSARHRRDLPAHATWIAHHYRHAGQEAQAAGMHALAAQHARSLAAHADAVEHLQAALALGHADRPQLYEALGDVHTLRGAYDEALTSYETAVALAGPDQLPQVEHRLGQLHQRLGEWTLAETHLRSALAQLADGAEPALRARVTADLSRNASRQGRQEEAEGLARDALQLAEGSRDPHALAQAHNVLGIISGRRGALEEAREHLEASLALTDVMDDPGPSVAARNNLARLRARAGDHEAAAQLLETALRDCRAQGDRHREAALRNNLADLLHAAGRDDDAMDQLKQAVALFAEVGGSGRPQPEIWKLVEW